MGHEDPFPRPGPNDRCRFGQETFARVLANQALTLDRPMCASPSQSDVLHTVLAIALGRGSRSAAADTDRARHWHRSCAGYLLTRPTRRILLIKTSLGRFKWRGNLAVNSSKHAAARRFVRATSARLNPIKAGVQAH